MHSNQPVTECKQDGKRTEAMMSAAIAIRIEAGE
jgi:hypothetical protein